MMFVEERILGAVRTMLTGAVNDYLAGLDMRTPLVEFGAGLAPGYLERGLESVTPLLSLTSGERTEKDRIVGLEAYTVSVTFYSPELEGELFSYAYAAAIEKALDDDATLGGAADRSVLVSKTYKTPQRPGTGEDWEAVFKLKVMVERIITTNHANHTNGSLE